MLSTSDTFHDIAKALAAAQVVMDNAIKDSANPAFRSKYADLAAVREAVNLPLAQNGIACVQAPRTELVDGVLLVSVETRLIHCSGQWFACTVSAGTKDATPQAVGSTITYLRRYGLLAITGIAPEDDDGNSGSGRHVPPPSPPRREEPKPAPPPEAKWTLAQQGAFCAELNALSMKYDNVAAFCEAKGRARPSAMTPEQRSTLLRYLLSAEGRAALDAFMAEGAK